MKLKNFLAIIGAITLLTGVILITNAQGDLGATLSAFRQYKVIDQINISVPTVVEIPIENIYLERASFAVVNNGTNSFEPYFFKKGTTTNKIPVTITAIGATPSANNMIDENNQTYSEFSLPEEGLGLTTITLKGNSPITSSRLTLVLENHVALPTSIEIRAFVNENYKIILAQQKLNNTIVTFPKTTATEWQIKLSYGQLLRISEFRLDQENAVLTTSQAIRFLAQPGNTYRVYLDPDRYVSPPVGEAGNLASDKDVVALSPSPSQSNLLYQIADIDNDGVPDTLDNCVSAPNPDQADVNANGRGDVCDDFDKDGVINNVDNCPDLPNRNQADEDSDGIGDVCDEEESRITERYKWIPWAGIGVAVTVLATLLIITAKSKPNNTEGEEMITKNSADTTTNPPPENPTT